MEDIEIEIKFSPQERQKVAPLGTSITIPFIPFDAPTNHS
jgi:hypothetical protein